MVFYDDDDYEEYEEKEELEDKDEVVMCNYFEMHSNSLSVFFDKSPKIHFICGDCGMYSTGRIPLENIAIGKPYICCKRCGTVNEIPIEFNRY